MVDVWQKMDKVKGHDDELTGSGGSGSGSNYSDLTALENETDELGKRIIQHQRDALRWQQAVHGVQLNSIRVRHRGLERDADLVAGLEAGHTRDDSQGSAESDPPVTVPREWGRKGRKSATWMRRIPQTSAPDEAAIKKENKNPDIKSNGLLRPTYISERAERRTLSVDDRVLELVGADTPPSMRRRGLYTPSSMHHMNTTLKHVLDSDDHDFTGLSLFASTPAPSRLPRKIDEVSFKGSNGDEAFQKAVLGTGAFDGMGTNGTRPPVVEQPTASNRPPTRIPHLSSPGRNKENVPPASSTTGEAKLAEKALTESRIAQAVGPGNVQRPKRPREDSLGLLRKLARVSSMSPIVSSQQLPPPPYRESNLARLNADLTLNAPEEENKGKRGSTVLSLRTANDVRDLRERLAAETVLKKQNACRAVLSTELTGLASRQPESSTVAGAWIEVVEKAKGLDGGQLQASDPAVEQPKPKQHPRARSSSLAKASNLDDDVPSRHDDALRRPRSALGEIILEAKGEGGLHLGESTIQSLEGLVDPATGSEEPTSTTDLAEPEESADMAPNNQLSQAEKDRRQETLAMESLNKHLRAARTSLKDANRGLRRVENKIETVEEAPPTLEMPIAMSGEQRNHAQCPTCAQRLQPKSAWKALWHEFRSLFWTWPAPVAQAGGGAWTTPRLTTLGLIVLAAVIWFVTEAALCEQYCHPLYASSMIDYGVDPDAPDFPFVIPTLLFRPFRWLWGPIMDALAAAATVISHYMFGRAATGGDDSIPESIVARDPPIGVFRVRSSQAADVTARTALADAVRSDWFATAAHHTSRVVGSAFDAAEEMGRMWEDEMMI